MTNSMALRLLACAAVLVSGPRATPGVEDSGGVRAAFCSGQGRTVIEIDFGGKRRPNRGHDGACHAACLSERKLPKPRGSA